MTHKDHIFVAVHKPCSWIPQGYEPVQAGAKGKKHFYSLTDDTGDNISDKNSEYCEMTVLYWIWKNTKSDSVGLVHYRRFFFPNTWSCSPRKILSKDYLIEKLGDNDILVPKPYVHRKKTVKSVYASAHHISDLEICRDYIAKSTPEYLQYFDSFINGKKISYFNMFVAKRHVFESYMQWVFPILDYCYERIDISQYDTYNRRVIGFIAERLFNVWLLANANRYKIIYQPVQKMYTNRIDILIHTGQEFVRTFTGGR